MRPRRLAQHAEPDDARTSQQDDFTSAVRRPLMAVTLFLPTVLAKLADGRAIESTGDTVGAVVADVATRYPNLAPRLRDETGQPYPFVTFYLNDEDIRFNGG